MLLRRLAVAAALLCLTALPAAAAPEGQMTWAVHVTLAARWLDPGDTEGAITPFMFFYAVHDAMLKPMPGGLSTPSLAESFTTSRDGLVYEFLLRNGARFHNGEAVTADDVKFTFERYRGAASTMLKQKVREVQIVDARRVRFVLREAWPDFITFCGTTATSSGWVVPKKYVERVGDDGFVPQSMEFALAIEPQPYDPKRARQLLAETGYASGFDAGDFNVAPPFDTAGQAIAGNLAAVGLRTRIRTMERAAFFTAWVAVKGGPYAARPRVEESALNFISAYPYSAPYEGVKLKRR
jgi:ABC-type transport system substrate-binding protein